MDIKSTISNIRSSYADLTAAVFTVNSAGDDCFVITSMTQSMFDPMRPLVDVSLVSSATLAQIKMLEQSSVESLIVYADTLRTVTDWLTHMDTDFPIINDQESEQRYYQVLGEVYETGEDNQNGYEEDGAGS